MNIKKSNIITAVLCTVALSVTSFYSGYAAANTASGIQYNSQGKIIFDNSTEDTNDDVVFDASDFLTIDSMITDGKTNIKNELNQYDNIEINEDIPAFDTLAASIGAISDGTNATAGNILSGKKALVGKNIVTGSMTDYSGSRTPTSNVTENGTNAEITIPGGYYDESSKITVPIEVLKKLPTINSNLSAINLIAYKTSGVNDVIINNNGVNHKVVYVVTMCSADNGNPTSSVVSVSGGTYSKVLSDYDIAQNGYCTNVDVYAWYNAPANGQFCILWNLGNGHMALLFG